MQDKHVVLEVNSRDMVTRYWTVPINGTYKGWWASYTGFKYAEITDRKGVVLDTLSYHGKPPTSEQVFRDLKEYVENH